MLHQTFLFLGQVWQLFEVSQILEFLRYMMKKQEDRVYTVDFLMYTAVKYNSLYPIDMFFSNNCKTRSSKIRKKYFLTYISEI